MLKTYKGSCHRGAVRFEAELDLTQSSYRCNCSICRRNRFWPAVAEPKGFRLISGQEMLTDCLFNMHGVHLGCLEGVTEEELSKIPITYVDGMHDRWQEVPRYTSHL